MTYPRPLRTVHWAIAILVTCQLAIAVVMTQLRSLEYGQLVLSLHRQLGLLVLLLVIIRFALARRYRPPGSHASELPAWQVRVADLVHRAFYLLLVVQPVLGILVAWARGDSIGLFGVVAIAPPMELSDSLREQLMTAHEVVAISLLCLCTVHIGAVLFNRIVRRVAVIDRMLAPIPTDRMVNRIPISAQLCLAFGLVIGIALLVGVNAVATYRNLGRSTEAFQNGDLAVTEQLREAQLAGKDLYVEGTVQGTPDAAHSQDLADSAKANLEEARAHAAGEIAAGVSQLMGQLPVALQLQGKERAVAIQAINSKLQDLIDSQSVDTLQHRTRNDDEAARGHDLIVVTVLPMLLAGLIAGLMLARSITGSLTRMGSLIKSIEANRQEAAIQVEGAGEIAILTRAIVSMRAAVESRGAVAAARQAELESERARLAREQLQREVEMANQQRIARQAQREQLASEFESRVTGIVTAVAETARTLGSTASDMAKSAAAANQRSRDASGIAQRTSGTSAQIAAGTGALSSTAQSVRENAEQSKIRAGLAVQEAAQAKSQIEHLVAATRQISGITGLITTVTRKTNLLAINARIEAARAGEAGRGFSIVADEVKALANQTREATIGIEKEIKEVNTAVARSSESLERLSEVIAGVDQAIAAIFAATDTQFAATRELAERVSEISSSTLSVARDIHEAQETTDATERMAAELVDAAAVIDTQAGQLREKVGLFVVQLRDPGAGRSTVSDHFQKGPLLPEHEPLALGESEVRPRLRVQLQA